MAGLNSRANPSTSTAMAMHISNNHTTSFDWMM
jgi:hypothetical protein